MRFSTLFVSRDRESILGAKLNSFKPRITLNIQFTSTFSFRKNGSSKSPSGVSVQFWQLLDSVIVINVYELRWNAE